MSKPIKITFFGLFGLGNLGNESTLEAILYNLRQHSPDAEVNCICANPEAIAATHNIAAVPMYDISVRPGMFGNNPLIKFLRRIFFRLPIELYEWVKALRALEGTDMLIVPGTQFLSDNLTGPFGWPYQAFKWSVAAKLRRCQLLFVSVGVGPLHHRLSRFFVKSALWLAGFRSYRDDLSREYLRRIGFDSTHDAVYPDLAFSLPTSTIPRPNHDNTRKPVIAVGIKNYHGQYDHPRPPQHEADAIYHRYIANMAAFVAWLLEHEYTVRIVIGDVGPDTPVLADLKDSLQARLFTYQNLKVIEEPIKSPEQLMSELAKSDIVVSPRYHNIVLGLLLNKPVFALSYHEKFSALLESTDPKYNVDVAQLDTNTVIAKFLELERSSEELRPHISRRVERYRRALDEQYRLIFSSGLQKR